ncbi:phosphatidylinositol 3 and 4-kinase-domain-containing protein [Terfezia claveryi]|nr:phosphatidylinositol 3 and 4-kinase-domain-containing protein [Terfezia claveryi]
MPRPPASGYERLAQHAELSDSDNEFDEDNFRSRVVSIRPPATSHHSREPFSPPVFADGRSGPPMRRNSSGVDIKAINARLERWAEEIASKFKIGKQKGRSLQEEAPLEIVYSVFVPPDGYRPVSSLGSLEPNEHGHITKEQFVELFDAVRAAISKGVEPKLIKQGSSGSYFMRTSDGEIVGVFKPKDEEPYGHLNPKTTKWLHRNLFPCFFGRSCLIPNLSYISEAAACVLDRQLRVFLVPHTEIVWVSSKSFHYDYWDRRAFYRKKKPLPPKVGSFQAFLQGFEDANIFFRKHPWPDSTNSGFRTDAAPRRGPWSYTCVPSGVNDVENAPDRPNTSDDPQTRRFIWTEPVQQQFREELEKLVVLDYIMRNTDRGLDNWMIKVEWENPSTPLGNGTIRGSVISSHMVRDIGSSSSQPESPGYQLSEPMVATPRATTPMNGAVPKLKIGAIDNSLAFPWKHPDQWRSFPFGWLFLPVSLIGQPFSTKTRDHFLSILTSPKWWSETQAKLRELFEMDADFKERMFSKQMAVLKGQAFNVVETLKCPDQGPLELTRRARVHVWDDEMEVPVAVPLRVPSSEAPCQQTYDEEEEIDIGATAVASAPSIQNPDVLGLGLSPPSDIPSAGRFQIGRSRISAPEEVQVSILSSSPQSIKSRPPNEPPLNTIPESLRQPQRGTSYDSRHSKNTGRKRGNSISAAFFGGDDVEGDLGYAAASDMENATRKVIVERLETVKANNPVFSWC